MQGVSKSFGEIRALQDVDLDVAAGEVVVLIGPSGSGKSTLCRCINRLEPVDAGTITVDGVVMPEEGKALAQPMVVATYTINDTRKEIVDFAGPYYVAGQDIMVKAGNTAITGVEDLNGKKVCSVQGSTSIENVAEQAPQADLSISFQTYSQCAEALADDRVEAVTTDNVILVGLIAASEGAFELVGQPFTEEPYGIGITKGDDDFRTFINDVLEEIYASGEWAAAFEATVGTAGVETPEPPPVDRY